MENTQESPLSWRKSSRSQGGANCVEVATTTDQIAIRDSKNPDGPTLTFQAQTWRDFVAGIQAGEFDL
ncbi:hypothetical protein HDA40_002056 [Hamadaea flava]|uniref:DUF397 domain-containing protein n=1 Tax=Hamadaea flava TaxID=1742688 RepID=A0ABV8LJF8_9ACTN|nr:DUF397 domain-containing protein [Hamadaea flava]MCP2323549.1 hypothetical protein [Hamadaea flava]